MKSTLRYAFAALVFGCSAFTGCGDDESEAQRAENRCEDMVDAYSTLWEGCGSVFAADEFPCDLADAIDDAKADACVADIQALNCSSKGTMPSSCAEALAK